MGDTSILPLLQNQHLWWGAHVAEEYKLTASVQPFIELLLKTGERSFLKNTIITTQGEGPQQCSDKPPLDPEHTNASFEPLLTNTWIVQLEITAYKVQLRNTAKKPWNVRTFTNNKPQT